MTDITTLVGVITLLLVLVLILAYYKPVLEWWDQRQTDRKRLRAHEGKVKCEEQKEQCDKIAVMLTHNGYFCDEHWEANSKYMVKGGYVTWSHQLQHSIRGY
jgi:hypothetical protein